MKHLRTFNESIEDKYRIEIKNFTQTDTSLPTGLGTRNIISLSWFIGNKKCGLFDVSKKEDGEVIIIGYMKYDKSVDGYKFIKLSIDYLLNNGIKSIISTGNRSIEAAKVWERLANENEYSIKTIDRKFEGYIPNRHSVKILTIKE